MSAAGRALVGAALAVGLAACGRPVELVVLGDGELDLRSAVLVPAPRRELERSGQRLRLLYPSGTTTVRIAHPRGCSEAAALGGRDRVAVTLRRLVALDGERAPLGFDAPFVVTARPGCAGAAKGHLEWAQASGPAIGLAVAADGWSARGRTPTLAALHPAPLVWGAVPLSPADDGEATLVATWRGAGNAEVSERWSLAAAARSSGLTSVPTGHPTLLGGSGWHIVDAPPGAHAIVHAEGGVTTFAPDERGRWRLADGAGRELAFRVGRYDETPLDCGRTECHPNAAAAALKSPMTRVLARGLDGEFGSEYEPRCAIACHAVGDVDGDDGGFVATARTLGFVLPTHGAPGGWNALSRPLRRLGGVGCTACHGPGAIPERQSRWAILRSDVCAVCHDAPPRYGHVAAWRGSKMAHADANPATRVGRCAACHTTAGFLASIDVRSTTGDWTPPADALPLGIGCAACHAPHDAHAADHLLRQPPLPAALQAAASPNPRTLVCLRCHAPLDATRADAGAAALWLGRGALDLGTGAARPFAAAHAAVAEGCIGCHADSAAAVERGKGHGFAVARGVCSRCHGAKPPEEHLGADGRTIAERARGLWQRLGGTLTATPPHASAAATSAPTTPRERARYDVALVLEDRAAYVHNAAYARALLDEAEALLR